MKNVCYLSALVLQIKYKQKCESNCKNIIYINGAELPENIYDYVVNDLIYLDGYSELIQVTFSTKNLKILVLLHCYLTLKDLAHSSCVAK